MSNKTVFDTLALVSEGLNKQVSILKEMEASVFLKDLAREVVNGLEVVELGTVMTRNGDKVVFDGKVATVYCREYPNEAVSFTMIT